MSTHWRPVPGKTDTWECTYPNGLHATVTPSSMFGTWIAELFTQADSTNPQTKKRLPNRNHAMAYCHTIATGETPTN